MPSKKDRREYFRKRRQALSQDSAWLAREAERKAEWYQEKTKDNPSRIELSDEEKAERRRAYQKQRRERIASDPKAHEAEKARKRESYHRHS
mgnify:CR=1